MAPGLSDEFHQQGLLITLRSPQVRHFHTCSRELLQYLKLLGFSVMAGHYVPGEMGNGKESTADILLEQLRGDVESHLGKTFRVLF